MQKYLLLILGLSATALGQTNQYQKNIILRGENENHVQFSVNISNPWPILQTCDPSKNYTILVHGWGEHVGTFWVRNTINNFLNFRKGCVIFMDY